MLFEQNLKGVLYFRVYCISIKKSFENLHGVEGGEGLSDSHPAPLCNSMFKYLFSLKFGPATL
jgi:hypothetical protein